MHRIACDFGMSNCTDQEVWNSLSDNLKSWRVKLGLPKASRWFSYNEQAAEQVCEFWASRMIMEWSLASENVESPEEIALRKTKFSQFYKGSSGLKLYYHCHSETCFEDIHILLRCQDPLWDFFSSRLHNVKSPSDGLSELASMTLDSQWESHWHLQGLAERLGSPSRAMFQDMIAMTSNESRFTTELYGYATQLLANRCSSVCKCCCPPDSWAPILSENAAHRQPAMDDLKRDWRRLVSLECAEAESAAELAQDLRLSFCACTRLVAQLFERDQFDCNSVQGTQALAHILGGFADSKIVEDVHQSLRVSTNSRANQRLSPTAVQLIVQNSGVLESREIVHSAHVDKATFLALWPHTKPDFKPKKDCKAQLHKLPEMFSRILTPKTWPTHSEGQLQVSSAAWKWVNFYLDCNLAHHGFRVKARKKSQWISFFEIFKLFSHNIFCICFFG